MIFSSLIFSQVFAQQVAVSADKNNVFYLGLDNPITVTVENCSCNDLVVKTDNGEVTGKGCQLIFRGKEYGRAAIMVYKKAGNKLKEIGSNAFRVKKIPPPVFRIGPYGHSYDRKARSVVMANQQYVRAELDGFDFDARFAIDSFWVKIFYNDSCKTKSFFNTTGKISQAVLDAFSVLKEEDVVIFHKIYAKGPDGLQWQLDPLILTIE